MTADIKPARRFTLRRRQTGPVGDRHLLRLIPPEGVPVDFRIASLGARFGAQMLDILLTHGTLLLLLLGAVWGGVLTLNGLATLFSLGTFFIRVPYYVLSELVWNGRTLGKRITRIRVINIDGRRLTPHQIVARNVMKEVEVFMPGAVLFSAGGSDGWAGGVLVLWMLGVLAVPFVNRRNQRLGDMIAGTVVVESPRPRLLPDLSAAQAEGDFAFTPAQLDIYGRYELAALEDILRHPPKGAEAQARVEKVSKAIRTRIRYDMALRAGDDWPFLVAFYRAQRQFLESRNLFGDRREDKFHRDRPRDG